ncbi:uncharacterized protein DEA37_0006140 [Paragonimus westermani]|uniref:Integrase catalytic domain-containing protein n=1 Tax=Paragonimus westermani TaxID=34504 RepID=A0A5J4N9D1_9TREM|nr:uncharacterized protein DEA37_0002938 [Paragonimus westermani]KAA3671972.1 uncharacterized protein DEA37_0002940 [Paragonimus westermani]KAA3676647.1 uncharacterized protein DEA37_0006140 [Paragonimus westermani]
MSYVSYTQTLTTPYHLRGNSLVERTNRAIMTVLRTLIEQHKSDCWDEILPQCFLAYGAAVHSNAGCTPSLLSPGGELRLPIEVLTPLVPAESIGLLRYVRELGERLSSLRNCRRASVEVITPSEKLV